VPTAGATEERRNLSAHAAASLEPRRVMWAVAEVCWADPAGSAVRLRGTIVDMSASGACIRLKDRVRLGSRLTIKWHREEFSALACNCRADGNDYLLGIRRDRKEIAEHIQNGAPPGQVAGEAAAAVLSVQITAADSGRSSIAPSPTAAQPVAAPSKSVSVHMASKSARSSEEIFMRQKDSEFRGTARREAARSERKVMQPKPLFPAFWRRRQVAEAPTSAAPKEAIVNKPISHSVEHVTDPPNHLLTYDDIYHAAGIMTPRSGYGIRKVVDMLNSERIRDLSKEIKRASVLMALDAAGASAEDILQDATRRQQALNTYEDGQRQQLEEYEARKAQEDAQIEAEMQRISSHYAERIQQNKEEVAKHKEALHNWQMAKQHESQRISEVIELCGKQPAQPAGDEAMAATAGAGAGQTSGNSLRTATSGLPSRS